MGVIRSFLFRTSVNFLAFSFASITGAKGLVRVGLITATVLGLAGCAAGGVPPVSDRSRATSLARSAGEYVVVAGDTLYSIAWRHQRDFRELATLNGIRAPYDIYPGQRLRVRGNVPASPRSVAPSAARSGQTVASTSAPAPNPHPNPHPMASTQTKPQRVPGAAPRTATVVSTAVSAGPAPQRKPSGSAKPGTAAPGTAVAPLSGTGPVALRWPSQGQQLRGFGEQVRDGQMPSKSIDFLLSPGASIRAAAAGEVVYVGRALAGFEQFVIVKHNDTWLSAYGFNATAAVRETQQLASGAVLATLARTPSGSARERELHFEVRKNGTPVNPATVIKQG